MRIVDLIIERIHMIIYTYYILYYIDIDYRLITLFMNDNDDDNYI
jgi:hypothetical protein